MGMASMAGMDMKGHGNMAGMDHGQMQGQMTHGQMGLGKMNHGGMEQGNQMASGYDFMQGNKINGIAFDKAKPMFDVKRGTYEKWTISGEGDMMLHPSISMARSSVFFLKTVNRQRLIAVAGKIRYVLKGGEAKFW